MDKIRKILTLRNLTPYSKEYPYPKGWMIIFVEAIFKDDTNVNKALERIMNVLEIITFYDIEKNWPNEDEWKKKLPNWLLNSFYVYTATELEEYRKTKVSKGWDYGSWLLMVQERVWEYWDCKQVGNRLVFTIIVDGWPYSVGAFAHLVKAAGAIKVIDDPCGENREY